MNKLTCTPAQSQGQGKGLPPALAPAQSLIAIDHYARHYEWHEPAVLWAESSDAESIRGRIESLGGRPDVKDPGVQLSLRGKRFRLTVSKRGKLCLWPKGVRNPEDLALTELEIYEFLKNAGIVKERRVILMGRISNALRTSRVIVEKPILANSLFAQIVKTAKMDTDDEARLNHSGAQSEIEISDRIDWRHIGPRFYTAEGHLEPENGV